MREPGKEWNIYYCGKPDEPSEETTDAAPDIPISKHPVPPADPSAQDASYRNDYDSDFPEEDTYSNAFSRFWLKKNHRNLKLFIVFLLLLLLLAAAGFLLLVTHKLNLIEYDPGVDFGNADQTDIVVDEDPVFTPMHDVTDASSLRDWLQKWAQNGGEKMHSKNVINCLLCGVDTQEETAGRTDAMILVSINKKTGVISLVSFMRDSYTYMNINGADRWYKINSAYNWGGAATLVRTVEDNYKVRIDNYVTVDFDTFPQLIDALGGVEVDVEEYEAKYIRRTSSHKKFPYGKNVRLNGDQALIYSRIRHSDSDGDVSRTRRQRKLITALIRKAKSASIGQLNNMLNTILPYVQTNYRRAQILSLGTQAIMQDWMSFDVEQISCPLFTESEDGQPITGKDSYIMTGYGYSPEFVWVVDYQLDARRIQTALYGMSNVQLADERVSPFDFLSGSSNYSSQTTRSYSYETTTAAYEEATSATRLIDLFPTLINRDRSDPDAEADTYTPTLFGTTPAQQEPEDEPIPPANDSGNDSGGDNEQSLFG